MAALLQPSQSFNDERTGTAPRPSPRVPIHHRALTSRSPTHSLSCTSTSHAAAHLAPHAAAYPFLGLPWHAHPYCCCCSCCSCCSCTGRRCSHACHHARCSRITSAGLSWIYCGLVVPAIPTVPLSGNGESLASTQTTQVPRHSKHERSQR